MKVRVQRRDGPDWRCCWCDKKFHTWILPNGKLGVSFRDATLEHLIPLASGGKHHLDNCAFACKKCNHARPSTSPLYHPSAA